MKALLFNLEDNGVHHRATVLVGDCRKVAVENNLVNMFDRISLGLLPSSEGGWRTAVKALRRATGGWLHIHGNVPFREVDQWVMWMCYQLYSFIEEDELISNQNEWCVIASHVEKVKSFAPTVNHYVADVFVGPFRCLSPHLLSCIQRTCPNICPGSIASIQTNETFRICNVEVNPPSCALAATGVLHQEWMR